MAKTLTFDEAFAAALKYFGGDNVASEVWVKKYALKDSDGNVCELTPDEMHRRMAKEIARVEARYPNPVDESEIFGLLEHFRYLIPESRLMSGIGNNYVAESLSSCFAIGLKGSSDSYGAIMHIDEEQVQLLKRRGGVGHDLSQLRPKGYAVKTSNLTSIGLVPFMERYSNTAHEIAPEGSLVLSLSVRHPEVEAFIGMKNAATNVAVKIDDEFMKAVINNRQYAQQFPLDAQTPVVKQHIEATDLWQIMMHNVMRSAQPEILFWDRITRESVSDCYDECRSICTNPSGEIQLSAYDSCRLLVMNLYSYVQNPFSSSASFNYELFDRHARIAQRIMDDIVDLELEKIEHILEKIDEDPESDEVKYTEKRLWEKIYEKTKLIRRTGIGLLGEDETVEAMNLRNGSHNAADFLSGVYRNLALSVYSSSVRLAKERGTFGIYNGEKETENAFINRIKDADACLFSEMQKYGRRNISCLASVRSEKKSLAALAHLPVIQEREGNDGIAKLKLYGELQKWSDHAVAVDIMLSAKADESLASKLYIEAWRNGCWVCNVRCEKNEATEPMSKDSVVFKQPIITEVRPQSLECDVVRFQNNKEKWVAFVGLLDGYPYEIFTGLQDDEEGIVLPKSVTKGKIIKNVLPDGTKRYDFQFQNKRGYKTTVEGLSEKFNKEYWNYAKLISGVLRYRMPTHYVIKLVGSLQLESESINTWKNGVKQALKKYVVNGTEAKGVMCPNCGSESLVYQDGNLICKECGEIR